MPDEQKHRKKLQQNECLIKTAIENDDDDDEDDNEDAAAGYNDDCGKSEKNLRSSMGAQTSRQMLSSSQIPTSLMITIIIPSSWIFADIIIIPSLLRCSSIKAWSPSSSS